MRRGPGFLPVAECVVVTDVRALEARAAQGGSLFWSDRSLGTEEMASSLSPLSGGLMMPPALGEEIHWLPGFF